jgi:hypothetical protein
MSAVIRTSQNAVFAAMLCATALIAVQVGSKATRDALFLSNFAVTSLPIMMIAAAAISIVMAGLAGRAMTAFGPSRLVSRALLGSGALLLVEWFLAATLPRVAAVLVYLHVAAFGSILISGFWSIVNESFDPRSAKQQIGRITLAATFGGLLGGLLAERVAALLPVISILPILSLLHLFAGAVSTRIKVPPRIVIEGEGDSGSTHEEKKEEETSMRQTLRRAPYLRNLGLLVFIGTVGAALLDYVFKARAVETVSTDAGLLRFFALFYTAVGFATFLVQSVASRVPMERLGLSARVTTHPLSIAVGAAAALLVPGLMAVAVARGVHNVLYNSLFRSGYEALFTPVAQRAKRATKAFIDVGFERAGDASGGGLVRLLLLLPATIALSAILAVAVGLGLVGVLVTRRLQAGYVRQLEQRLLSGLFYIDPAEIEDPMTRTMMMGTIATVTIPKLEDADTVPALVPPATPPPDEDLDKLETIDPLQQRIRELRSGDPVRVLTALRSDSITPELAPHVLPLLAWDALYPHAARALSQARERIEGLLVDHLLDKEEEFSIRRRIPGILSGSSSRIVIQGLLQGLLDSRFEVRYRCGRALARIHARDASVPIDRHRVFAIVLRETRVDRGVWESQRLLDQLEDSDEDDEKLRQRSNRSLEHVFTVLSLALDKKPLQIAFRGLHTDDPMLRGTALEYLESALPDDIRDSLWPFLETSRTPRVAPGDRERILDALMNSHQSIELNLEALKKRLSQEPPH